jgi:lipoyl-dependent peroxiredoxin
MAKKLYTAQAHVTGGRMQGHGRTASGSLEVDIRVPAELGGEEEGTNPEELFAVGYAACFDNAMTTVARRMKLEPGDTAVDSKVSLAAGDDRSFVIVTELDVTVPGLDDDQAVELVRAAHAVCPYSNATRGSMDVTLTANGRPVD